MTSITTLTGTEMATGNHNRGPGAVAPPAVVLPSLLTLHIYIYNYAARFLSYMLDCLHVSHQEAFSG